MIEMIKEFDDVELSMIIKIGKNYDELKEKLEKYSRDMWF